MVNKMFVALVIVAFLSFSAWSGQGQGHRTRSVRYEYQVLPDPTETADMEEGLKRLNELGAQGWELSAVSRRGNAPSKLYLKRAHGSSL